MVLPPCPCCSAPNPASAQPSASLAQALHPKNDMYIIFQCTGFYVRLPHCIERSASYVWMGLHSCNAWIMQEKYCTLVSNLFRSQNTVFFAKKKSKSKSVKVISIKQTNKTKNFDWGGAHKKHLVYLATCQKLYKVCPLILLLSGIRNAFDLSKS